MPDVTPPGVRLTAAAKVLHLLTEPPGSTTPPEPVEASAGAWAVPWSLAVLVLLLARRNRARRKAREAAPGRDAVQAAMG
ncbi:hypothetical protein ACPCKW_27735 [Streptomyces griseoincarnatus]